jgi:hypothetical protein
MQNGSSWKMKNFLPDRADFRTICQIRFLLAWLLLMSSSHSSFDFPPFAMRLKSALTLAAIALIGCPAHAASILWVQNNDGIDAGWKTLLEGDGHTLTAFTGNRGLPTQADKDYVNSFDLVVITRTAFNQSPTSGGTLLRDAGIVWNTTISVPLIMMQAYLPAGHYSSNWGWTSTNAGSVQPQSVSASPMIVNDASDPIWEGVTVSNGNPTPSAIHTTNSHTIGSSTNTVTLRPGAVVIASSPDNNKPLIARLPAGITVNGGDLAGERLIFNMRTDNDGMNLTTLGQQVFLNAVNDMIPEPSSVALLALSGLALLRRKRR